MQIRYPERCTKKQKLALCLRDTALRILRARGMFEITNLWPCLQWRGNGLNLLLRTPFQKLPRISDRMRYMAALLDADPDNLPYGLDIWVEGRGKVLNIEWDLDSTVAFVCFHRGEWEARLIALDEELKLESNTVLSYRSKP